MYLYVREEPLIIVGGGQKWGKNSDWHSTEEKKAIAKGPGMDVRANLYTEEKKERNENLCPPPTMIYGSSLIL